MSSFKEFWKDMWALQMESNKFMKKHWKGYLLFVGACGAAGFVGELLWIKAQEKRSKKLIEEVTREES